MRTWTILTCIVLVCSWFVWRRCYVRESFILDVPDSVDVETVTPDILQFFRVYKTSALQHDTIMEKCASQESDVGTCKTYTVNDMSLKAFVEDVYNSKGDYNRLRHKYESFPMAIVYNSESNNILYYTVEKPWNLKQNFFQDEKMISKFEAGRVYIPIWSYSKSDSGPLSIDSQCLKILNEWKNSEDVSMIKQIEQSDCLSRSNKIKFVGMILMQYLKILRTNRFGFARACGDFKGITSNIRNPELRNIFDNINKVCKDFGGFAEGIEQSCVAPVDSWLDSENVASDTACLSSNQKSDVIARITKLLQIGDHIPVDFLDSFYLVVTKLYNDTKNNQLKDALRDFTSTNEHAEKWKTLFDSLYKGVIYPKSILINGKAAPQAGLTGDGWRGSTKDFPITMTFIYDNTYKFNTIISQAVGKLELKKFALSYEDPFLPGKYVDFERVFYSNNSTKIDQLNGIITKKIKIQPLEKGDIGGKLGFEGLKIALDKCAQKISLCEMDSSLSAERSRTDTMRRRYDLERKNRMEMLQQLSAMTTSVKSLEQKLKDSENKHLQNCPPQVSSAPPIKVNVKKLPSSPPPTTYILYDSSKTHEEQTDCDEA